MIQQRFTYLNLTNGLEWVDSGLLPSDVRFMRMESTDIEHRHWCRVLLSLPDDLLFNLSRGHSCIIFDCGAGRPTSKTISVGVPFVRAAIAVAWSLPLEAYNHHDVALANELLGNAFSESRQQAKRHLGYHRRWVSDYVLQGATSSKDGGLPLFGVSQATAHDGDIPYFHQRIRAWESQR